MARRLPGLAGGLAPRGGHPGRDGPRHGRAAGALRAEMADLFARYRRVGQGNPNAKRVVVYTTAVPLEPAAPQNRR